MSFFFLKASHNDVRSSIGVFPFVPLGINERLIEKAGLRLVRQEYVTTNSALVAGRWHKARQRHKDDLLLVEGEERFEGLQRFFAAVYQLGRKNSKPFHKSKSARSNNSISSSASSEVSQRLS